MTPSQKSEYQELEIQSSNLLLERDSHLVLGRHSEAAYAAFQAGSLRDRMGQFGVDSQEWLVTIEDWLFAAECFYWACAESPFTHVLEQLKSLHLQGRFPQRRQDLLQAWKERITQNQRLQQRKQEFLQAWDQGGHQLDSPSDSTLAFLYSYLPHLPGYYLLHFAISRQAYLSGKQSLYVQHLTWAVQFAPENAHLTALLGYCYFTMGTPEQALELGQRFLTNQPQDGEPVRAMLRHISGIPSQDLITEMSHSEQVLRSTVQEQLIREEQQIQTVA